MTMNRSSLIVGLAVLLGACSSQQQAPEQAKSAELQCTLNAIKSTCTTSPAANGGFTIEFSHGDKPSYTFTPVGEPTTDKRVMVDQSGQRWEMSGHHSFELEEIGGYDNEITVSNP